MNELCIKTCAPRRDASGFELKDGTEFATMPRFSLNEWNNRMTNQERKVLLGLRLLLMEEHLRGKVSEEIRTIPYISGKAALPETIEIRGVVYSANGRVASDEGEETIDDHTEKDDEEDKEQLHVGVE